MTQDEKRLTGLAMREYGGSFVQALGQCLLVADPQNSAALIAAFPRFINEYGPGSNWYIKTQQVEE